MAGTPGDAAPTAADVTSLEQRQAQLIADGVRLIACTFVDLAGVTRVKAVPVGHLAAAVRSGIGMSYVSTVFTVDDQIASSPDYGSPVGDMRLRPDPAAIVPLADAPGWAWAPVNQDSQELEPVGACPRHALASVEADAASRGLTFRMASEVEFTLYDAEGQPVHRGPGYGARALMEAGDFPLELVDVLAGQGIDVQQIHPEYATAQYEISIAPDTPVRAADRHVLLRATIIRVARRHGYQVSFAPVVVQDSVGNGAHVHLSAWREGHDLMSGGDGPCGMTGTAESFVAGVLDRLPELSAVLTPSVISYLRLVPSHWSAPFTCWGPENREAALRFVRGTVGTHRYAANVELKPIDAAANPYLSLAMAIAAGLDGIDRDLRLPDPLTVDPASLSEAERAARGIDRLPTDLADATDRLATSTFARTAMGDPLFHAFLAVRRLEWDTFGEADAAAVIEAHRWRYG